MRFLAFLIFLFFCLFTLVARWYYMCELRQMCDEQAVELVDARAATLKLTENGTAVLEGYDQFAFEIGSVEPRLNANNELFIDTLAYYLNRFPAKNITITAFYREAEKDSSYGYFENLGTARAAAIRTLLVEDGIEESRITLDYGLSEDIQLSEPMTFESYIPEGPEEFEKIQFTFKNMTFSDANFQFDSYLFNPGSALLLYADSVKAYLDLNPDKGLTIIGHTDQIGESEYNEELGLKRAKSAKEYFQEKYDISSKRIQTESEGEGRPVAENKTHEGRQKNRRVNFVLQ